MLGVSHSAWQADYNQALHKQPQDTVETDFCQTVEDTREMEMQQFQQEFWDEVARIPRNHSIEYLMINVTKEGWERMKADPEYRARMMSLLRRDMTGMFYGKVSSIITIGSTEEEYRAVSWSSERDRCSRRNEEESYYERRRKRRKEFQKRYEKLLEKRRLDRKWQEQKRVEKYLLEKRWQEQKRLEQFFLESEADSLLYAEPSRSAVASHCFFKNKYRDKIGRKYYL